MSETNFPTQRDLVLQVGGALGAYEAGVFEVLYRWIKKDIKDKNENFFDIVAGTSIGAINGAVLVSHVKQNGNWDGSASKLSEFWQKLSHSPNLSNWWPFWPNWPLPWDLELWIKGWENRKEYKPDAATPEAARRYYSAKQSLLNGAKQVFSRPKRLYDDKFFDDFSIPPNHWYLYDNQPLMDNIERYASFPLATAYDTKEKEKGQEQGKKQPRLLIVAVDIEEAEMVVFDSYIKKDETKYTKYGYSEKSQEFKQKIEYNEGLMVEHVMASASVPLHYDFTYVPVRYDYTKTKKERENDLKGTLQLQKKTRRNKKL